MCCIDLIFTDQPNYVIDCGTHPSLNKNCHHQITKSHLIEQRFKHNFQNCFNLLCSCSLEIESTSHFLLHCHHYTNIHLTLLNSIAEIIGNTFNITNECLVNLLLFGSPKYTEAGNSHIINAAIEYLLDSKMLDSKMSVTRFFNLQINLILVIFIAD